MTLDPKTVATRLGPEHVGQMPDFGSGAFGMLQLRLHSRNGWNPRPRMVVMFSQSIPENFSRDPSSQPSL